MSTVAECRIVELPQFAQPNGSLTPVHGLEEVPFEIQRIFYVYDVVAGATRGGHAHRQLEQFIVCIIGSVTVLVDDAAERRELELNRPHQGLYVPTDIWADLVDFSGGAVALVLASLPYDEGEYIRDYHMFVRHRRDLTP
jgi:dTDP-4-dehydrorhamnose 3,5-epimerase-like enzyme